ncbi:MAG: hypothetical protein DMG84_20845, partial [Acidobacteria bacterium]
SESALARVPLSFAFFAKGWGLFREVEGNLLSRVFPQPISAMPLKQILFTPRASASLARAPLTQPSGLCPLPAFQFRRSGIFQPSA